MNTNVRIERVCGGIVRLERYPDKNGRFSFQLGGNVPDYDAANQGGNSRTVGSMAGPFEHSGDILRQGKWLAYCEIRAAYPGYLSNAVPLASNGRTTIVLRRVSNVQGTALSLTTLAAPKNARKAYDRGMNLAGKGKFDQAVTTLTKATEMYPKYAIAWVALGQIYRKQGRLDDARHAFEAATGADSRYLTPYEELALIAAERGKWQECADYSNRVLQMNAFEFPNSFWYNALANYRLKRFADAEKSLRELIRLDTQHAFPVAEKLLGQMLIEKGELAEGATHMRAYLSQAPNANDADAVRNVLVRVETLIRQSR